MQLPPPVHGVTASNQLVKNCIEQATDIDSRIIAMNYNQNLSDLHTKSFFKVVLFLKYLWALVSALWSFKPDKVYFVLSPHGVAFLRDLVLISLVKIAGCRLVFHLHGKGIREKRPIMRRLYAFAFDNSDLICLSPKLVDDVADVATGSQVFVVPNAIEQSAIPSDQLHNRAMRHVQADEPLRLLMFSNLQISKGIFDYLRVSKQLLELGADMEFHLAGPFTASFSVAHLDDFLLSLGVHAKRFVYHGAVYNEEKFRLLQSMDILVHPSHNDALPLVIIEALASGLAVISTPQGGIPDLLDEVEGSAVVPLDELACAITTLAENKHRLLQFAQASVQRFEQRYTTASFNQSLLAVLNQPIN